MFRKCIFIWVGVAWLSACAPADRDRPPLLVGVKPEPPPPYRVQVGDVLGVRLYTAPELDEDVTVRPDGRISTILAPSVSAAGRTADEVAADLLSDYETELKNPKLSVEVKTASPTRVYVAGEVVSPGEFFDSGPNPTLLQAVARAGGLRPTGDAGHVFILRHGLADSAIILPTEYRRAAAGEDPAGDVRLAPFDIVYVPKTGIASAYVWFNQHFQQFVPVSWGFSYNVNPYTNQPR